MVEVGWDLWRSFWSTPLYPLKQGHLVDQDRVQDAFEYPQARRCHDHPGKPVLVLSHA